MKKILLDENLPKQLKNHFSNDFEVISVPDLGWQSKENGELLAAMDESGIEYLLTVDKNLRFQQNLSNYKVRIILLLTYSNRLKILIDEVAEIETKIKQSDSSNNVIEIDLRK